MHQMKCRPLDSKQSTRLEILGGISSKLEDFCGQVLCERDAGLTSPSLEISHVRLTEDGSSVDSGSGSDTSVSRDTGL